MNAVSDSSGIADVLAQALQVAKEGQRAQEEAESQTVEAEAADGQVRATVSLTGKVKVEIIDPRAIRLGAEVLSEEITKAVNAALEAARDAVGVPGAVDLAELSGKIEQIQQQSTERLKSFMGGLADAHSQIIRASGDGR